MTVSSSRLVQLLRPALVDKVERDHRQPDSAFLRRRVVVVVVLLVGATLLGISLSVPPGSPAFYPLTLALAAVWVVGGLASGPLHLGRIPFRGTLRRPVVTPIVLGLMAVAVFVLGALVVRQIPPLRDFTQHVLAHARYGSLPLVLLITVLNGIAEEVFFRGALFAAIGARYPVLISTAVYAVATHRHRQPDAGVRRRDARAGPRAAAPCLRRGAGADPDPHHLVVVHGADPAAAVRRRPLTTARAH